MPQEINCSEKHIIFDLVQFLPVMGFLYDLTIRMKNLAKISRKRYE